MAKQYLKKVIANLKYKRFMQKVAASAFSQTKKAAFDDKVHPKVGDFWSTIQKEDDSAHRQRVRKHPLYRKHGEELSKESYRRYHDHEVNHQADFNTFHQIIENEQEYKGYLERLAVRIISEIWDCPEELLEAHLEPPPGGMVEQPEEPKKPEESEEPEESEPLQPDSQIDPRELQKHIEKRVLLNTLTHGAALHQMMTAHHLARKEISEFDDELIDLYDHMAKTTHKTYWQVYVEPVMAAGQGAMLAGAEQVEWQEDGSVKVKAYGMIFPILLQELAKGVMEVLTAHSLSEIPEHMQGKVVQEADRLDEEQWLIQVGPELWRRFLKAIPKDVSLSELITQFSLSKPSEVQYVLETVVNNPDEAKEILQNILDRN